MTKNSVTAIAIAVCLFGVLLGAATFLIPVAEHPYITQLGIHLFIAIPLAFTVFQLEAVWLFAAGLRHFKTALRIPYIRLCIALLLLAIAQIQLPVVGLLNVTWYINGFINIPYVLATILFFTSTRSFAQLLEIKGFWTSYIPFWLAVVVSVATVLVPQHATQAQPTVFAAHMALGTTTLEVALSAIAACHIYRIKQAMSVIYNQAMGWLFGAILSYGLAQFQYMIMQGVGYDNPFNTSGLSNILFFVSALIFVRAGYAFWELDAESAALKNVSLLDVVTYTANLATNPRVINPTLDRVRTVSLHVQPGAPLSEADQVELAGVYLELEDYLTQKEPLRSFTREGLRKQVARMFPHDPDVNATFWARLA
ncbi:MAG TPA: hypothetical protein VHQ86_01640 [Candidatus Saccharimonadia bacterium]|jgi:hypothetical protein|nr:hypothetical protein [Candidatus Saccharimonadia bacterium]